MSTFRLTVSTPDGEKFSGDAEALFVRGSEGDLAVLADHAPLVTAVKGCTCRIVTEDGEISAEITGGLLNVAESGDTVLLTMTFEQ